VRYIEKAGGDGDTGKVAERAVDKMNWKRSGNLVVVVVLDVVVDRRVQPIVPGAPQLPQSYSKKSKIGPCVTGFSYQR
jgi:hypothetical protein